jgi:hypothetical protein
MNTPPRNEQPAEEKLTYKTPEIIDYGWIENITLSAGVTGSDTISGSAVL